jgi:hypothetical protein
MAWLRKLLTALAAFGLSWAGAVGYWRANNRMPATDDLILLLIVLPLALLTAFWLGKKLWRRLSMPAAAGAATSTSTASAASAPAAAPVSPPLRIVAAALRSPHGMSAEALGAALLAQQARPQLDGELVDDHGYPVLAARIADIDSAAAREEIGAWLQTQTPALPPSRFDDAQWRALAAGDAVVRELAATLAAALPAISALPAPSRPVLRLLPLWQDGWRQEERQAALAWFRHLLTTAGWPQESLSVPSELGASDAAEANGGDAAAVLARLLAMPAPADGGRLALVLACGSLIGESGIDTLSGAGALFTSRHMQGQIPGEGAAALLLADAGLAAVVAPTHDAQPPAELVSIATARRGASADEDKRGDSTALRAAGAEALATARCDAAAVTLIAADTDHRTSRVMETMGLMSDGLSHLDAGADLLSVGAACGSCGAVTYLTALVLAASEAQERNGAVLCIGNLDAWRRSAAVLRPGLAAPAPAPFSA